MMLLAAVAAVAVAVGGGYHVSVLVWKSLNLLYIF